MCVHAHTHTMPQNPRKYTDRYIDNGENKIKAQNKFRFICIHILIDKQKSYAFTNADKTLQFVSSLLEPIYTYIHTHTYIWMCVYTYI